MAIVPSSVPDAAVQVVSRAVAGGMAKSTFMASYLLSANTSARSLSMPHRVAYLPLNRIQRDLKLREAARIGDWRFLVHEKRLRPVISDETGGEREQYVPIAAATAAMTEAGKYELGEISEGAFVEGTETAIRLAEDLEVVRQGSFEAFLLVSPAVHVVALWLQDGKTGADVILPIPPSNSALVPYQTMTPAAFLDVLQRLAEKVPLDEATDG